MSAPHRRRVEPRASAASAAVRTAARKPPPPPLILALAKAAVLLAFALGGARAVRRRAKAPDREAHVARLRLAPAARHTAHPERLLVCMPTVARAGGAEYVSNAVKSWALAAPRAAPRLAVFEMDADAAVRAAHRSAWMSKVGVAPPGLVVRERGSEEVVEPVRRTHGDDEARVRWRSKEALDYAEVLERCAEMAEGRYVAVVQDDVLFTAGFRGVVDWLDVLHGIVGERWCSASLFDLPTQPWQWRWFGADMRARELQSSNMVARVWDLSDDRKAISGFVAYVRRQFDSSPVDWLAGSWCKKKRRRTWTSLPNLVRHRGMVSSFEENSRKDTLT